MDFDLFKNKGLTKFKVGDVVRLKSGGTLKMTITNYHETVGIVVMYERGKSVFREYIDTEDALVLVDLEKEEAEARKSKTK